MTKALAKVLEAVANNNNIELEVRDDYSGRFMYGETTYAIVIDSMPEFNKLIYFLGREFGKFEVGAPNVFNNLGIDDNDVYDVEGEIEGLSIDQMGLGWVIY